MNFSITPRRPRTLNIATTLKSYPTFGVLFGLADDSDFRMRIDSSPMPTRLDYHLRLELVWDPVLVPAYEDNEVVKFSLGTEEEELPCFVIEKLQETSHSLVS